MSPAWSKLTDAMPPALNKLLARDDSQQLAMLVALGVVVVLVAQYIHYARGKLRLPGPIPLPIVGNLLSLDPNPTVAFMRWAKKFGDIYKITLGEREVLVFSSLQAAKELFGDQGSTYISRPQFHNYHTVLASSAGLTIGTSPWDESCKKRRKVAATALNKSNVENYLPIVERETLALITDLYNHGEAGKKEVDPAHYCSRYALNTSLSVNYGVRLDNIDDGLLNEILTVEANVSDIRSHTASWADYIPLVRSLPSFKKGYGAHTTDMRVRRDEYMGTLLRDLQDRIAKGTDVPCITGNVIKDPETTLNQQELMSICLTMVAAGLDTLGNTLLWASGYFAKHPELWEKAYEEINKVYHGDVPDSLAQDVPYVSALGKELGRYFFIVPSGLPHQTVGDSEYRGVHIPDGTTVFMNTASIHRDPRYGDGDVFRPERFMQKGPDGTIVPEYAFGLGRRMCLGHYLATRELYSALTKLIFFFKIELGPSGDFDIDPITAMKNPYGLACAPKDFKVRFVPRDREILEHWLADESARADINVASVISEKATKKA